MLDCCAAYLAEVGQMVEDGLEEGILAGERDVIGGEADAPTVEEFRPFRGNIFDEARRHAEGETDALADGP